MNPVYWRCGSWLDPGAGGGVGVGQGGADLGYDVLFAGELAVEDGRADGEAPNAGFGETADLVLVDDRAGSDGGPIDNAGDGGGEFQRIDGGVAVGEQVHAVDALKLGEFGGVRGDLLDGAEQCAGVPGDAAGEGGELDSGAGELLDGLGGELAAHDPVHAGGDGGVDGVHLVSLVDRDHLEVDHQVRGVRGGGQLTCLLGGGGDVLEADVAQPGVLDLLEDLQGVVDGAVVVGEHEDEFRHCSRSFACGGCCWWVVLLVGWCV